MTTTKSTKKLPVVHLAVKFFGEGNTFTRKDFYVKFRKNKDVYKKKYTNFCSFRKDENYRISRGTHIATTSENPKEIRDRILKSMKETKVSASAKNNPLALAKMLSGAKSNVKARATQQRAAAKAIKPVKKTVQPKRGTKTKMPKTSVKTKTETNSPVRAA